MKHECKIEFDTRKIDDCTGIGWNKCTGIAPMIFEIYFEDKDGTETFFDNWAESEVRYCPYCGLKAETPNE